MRLCQRVWPPKFLFNHSLYTPGGREGKEGWNKIREQGRGREKSEASKGGVGTCRREERKGEQVRRRGSKAYIRKRREKGTAKSNYRKDAHSKFKISWTEIDL